MELLQRSLSHHPHTPFPPPDPLSLGSYNGLQLGWGCGGGREDALGRSPCAQEPSPVNHLSSPWR